MRRDARLASGAALDRLFKEGAVINGPLFVFRYLPNTLGYARWAFAVGERAAPLAVTRNAVRRRMRAAARAADVPGAYDIAVVAKVPALKADVATIARAIERAAARAAAGEGR
jgi:ribonuclease P protein component